MNGDAGIQIINGYKNNHNNNDTVVIDIKYKLSKKRAHKAESKVGTRRTII